MVERLVAAEQVIGSNPIVTFSSAGVDEGSDVECGPFRLFLPVVLWCSPSIWWLRLRLVSVCPRDQNKLREHLMSETKS